MPKPNSTRRKSRTSPKRAGGKQRHFGGRGKKHFKHGKPPAVPDVIDVEVTGLTEDGEPFGQAVDRKLRGEFPRIIFPAKANVGMGQIVPCKLIQEEGSTFLAKPQPQPEQAKRDLIGELRQRRRDWVFTPYSREFQAINFYVPLPPKGAQDGQVVLAKAGNRPSQGATPVEITKILADDPAGLEVTIAQYNYELPDSFPADVLAEAEKLPATLSKAEIAEREDLRKIPLVTIDGADAKDFDDAVWAEKTPHGFHIIVAIADVAHYVQPGSALDDEAQERGNSTYFPGKVIPMLPERLSNDLCSLVPKQDRPVLAVHMWIDDLGRLKKYNFVRGVMHSAARLTYDQVQAALDGTPDATTKPLLKTTLEPLLGVYKALLGNRDYRGAIDLDVPEPHLFLNDDGSIIEIGTRIRFDSHRLIEECMILANVAAATALETRGAKGLFRVHPEPGSTKYERLRVSLASQDIKLKKPDKLTPRFFQKLAKQLRNDPAGSVLLQALLQSQEQARYDAGNIGHFGLALLRYSHFTSPIRRYSDLIVHRALIKTLNLPGAGGYSYAPSRLDAVAEHINKTERRSQRAEWEARDRLVSSYYAGRIGEKFEATVTSVQPFGLFVQLADGMSEGLIPLRLMHDNHYRYDGAKGQLIARKGKRVIKLGTKLDVELTAADHISGQLTFGLARSTGREASS